MAKLYTPNQVADILQVSAVTVKRWLNKGVIPGIKIGPGGQWRIRSDELTDYIESGRKRVND